MPWDRGDRHLADVNGFCKSLKYGMMLFATRLKIVAFTHVTSGERRYVRVDHHNRGKGGGETVKNLRAATIPEMKDGSGGDRRGAEVTYRHTHLTQGLPTMELSLRVALLFQTLFVFIPHEADIWR